MVQQEEGQARDPLYSDYERISNLLNDAQNLGKKNKQYDPAIFRDYFVTLYELFRFLYPILGETDKTIKMKERIDSLDIITRNAYRKLLLDKDYKVSSKIFEVLSDLHQELLIFKHKAQLGIRMREYLTSKKKIERALE